MNIRKKIVVGTLAAIVGLFALSLHPRHPSAVIYGVSFSRFHSDELGLDWKKTYLALLNDLHVRHFRFSAHWPLTELADGTYHFDELDFQMDQARQKGADVILAVGRRLPGWPECHVPAWAAQLSQDQRQEKLLAYVRVVVNRYKNYPNIKYWQVENEPYLTFFSRANCGDLDEQLMEREIALVRALDPRHAILLTDSGELSTWHGAYTHGDIFGTSVYLYIWKQHIGPFRYPLRPGFLVAKQRLARWLWGEKPIIAIEVSAEPWLLKPIVDVPISTQMDRMNPEKFQEMLQFTQKAGFDTAYLWGAEWWYWLKLHGQNALWNSARSTFPGPAER